MAERTTPSWQGIRGSRHERGYGSAWDKLRKVVLSRDEGWCVACLLYGRHVPAKTVDHVIPKSEGGGDELSNLQSLCADCHAEKSSAEGAFAQGRAVRKKTRIGVDGWPE